MITLDFKQPRAVTALDRIRKGLQLHGSSLHVGFIDKNTLYLETSPAGIEVDVVDSVLDDYEGMYGSL